MLVTLTIFGSACAGHLVGRDVNAGSSAVASLPAELTLLQAASELGYSPVVIKGNTVFCKREQLTGTMVPTTYCVDADFVMAQARTERESIEALDQQPTPGKYPKAGPL